jgi:acyl-CoA synthetase (AMP-forming)/AMP-acid ligase II
VTVTVAARPASLAHLLFSVTVPDDRVLVHCGPQRLTGAGLRAGAERLAARLRRAGIGPGRAVAVSLANRPETIAAHFGVWRAGAALLPLNPRAPVAERRRVLAAVRPAAVVGPATGRGLAVRRRRDPAAFDPDVALVQLTSGTTGPPRPVPLTHHAVGDLLERVVGALRAGPGRPTGTGAGSPGAGDVGEPMPNLVPVSLSLWAGIYQVLFAFRLGAPVVLMERFEPRAFARLVAEHRVRSVVLPPAAMHMLLADPAVDSLAPLRRVRSITAPLPVPLARRFMDRFGVTVLNSYGQTELGGEVIGWTAADARHHLPAKLGAVGRPHRGVEVRVVDDTGTPLPNGAVGELVVRTPGTRAAAARAGARAAAGGAVPVTRTATGSGPGGAGDPLAGRLDDDGWLRTGDLARLDPDGFVWIEGRRSDMINRGGLKVAPQEVEDVLLAQAEVTDAAVVGRPDERLGELPWAYVVAAPGRRVDPDRLRAACRAHLAPYKVPAGFSIVEALPRNEAGKVLRRVLATGAGGAGAPPPRREPTAPGGRAPEGDR